MTVAHGHPFWAVTDTRHDWSAIRALAVKYNLTLTERHGIFRSTFTLTGNSDDLDGAYREYKAYKDRT